MNALNTPATIYGQTGNTHLQSLANNIQSGIDIIETAKKEAATKNRLAEPYEYDASDISSQWLPQVQKENEDMLNREVYYRQQGIDWYDPKNTGAYAERIKMEKSTNNSIDTYKAITKQLTEAKKLLSDDRTTGNFDYNKSAARIGELANAKNFEEAQSVMEKYNYNLLEPARKVDLSGWTDKFDNMLSQARSGSRYLDTKEAVAEGNKNLDVLIGLFDQPNVKNQFINEGGTEEEWNSLKEIYAPQLEASKFIYDATADRNRSAQNFRSTYDKEGTPKTGKVEADYMPMAEKIYNGDQEIAGLLTGASIDDDKVIKIRYATNKAGQKNLVLTTTAPSNRKTYTNDEGEEVLTDKLENEVWINLSDPQAKNQILSLLTTSPGAKEQVDKVTVTEEGALPIIPKKQTKSGLPIF